MIKKNNLKKFNISNKLAYTLIAIFSFIFIGVGVYAYGGSVPATMGHSTGELSPPTGCTTGQVLGMVSGGWNCVTHSTNDIRFTLEERGLCYTAPPSCAITSEYCSQYVYVPSVFINGGCDQSGQTELNQMCYGSCMTYPPACDGYNSNCNSGTTVYWTASGYCSNNYYLQCTCSASQYYSKSTYTPAGTRCIYKNA